jgi:hypothetical protein
MEVTNNPNDSLLPAFLNKCYYSLKLNASGLTYQEWRIIDLNPGFGN